MQRTVDWSRTICALALVSTVLLTSGCTGQEERMPVPAGSSTPSASARPTPPASGRPTPSTPSTPVLAPDGSADDNLVYFDTVNSAYLASNPMPGGRAIIDNLVAAGFDKSVMQVTPDATTIGSGVDSVQFSVRFGDRCLIGQSSSAVGYVGTVGPVAEGTSCLIGSTRVIDW